MRVTLIATVLVLAGLGGAGLATAGEEAFSLDLRVLPGGSLYFVKCSRSASLADCGLISLWEQTNGHPGLQSTIYSTGNRAVEPDFELLP